MKWPHVIATFALAAFGVSAESDGVVSRLFGFLPQNRYFSACLQTVRTISSSTDPFNMKEAQSVCVSFMKGWTIAAPSTSVPESCLEFAGRVIEANEQGYLGNGTVVCGRLVKESALVQKKDLALYKPAEGSDLQLQFCKAVIDDSLCPASKLGAPDLLSSDVLEPLAKAFEAQSPSASASQVVQEKPALRASVAASAAAASNFVASAANSSIASVKMVSRRAFGRFFPWGSAS